MRIPAVAAVVVALVALGACASSTAGSGAGAPAPPAGSTSTAPPSPSPPSPSIAGPSIAGPSASTHASSAPASSAPPPEAVRAPPACAAGKCVQIASSDLGDGYTASVHTGPSPSGQVAADYLRLARFGVPVFWKVTDGDNPGELVCSSKPAPNCAVEDAFGAHASSARGLLRIGDRLVQFDEATSDTPLTDVQDLNGDGWIDVVAAQNTYQPDYATGRVFWTTSLSTGRKFLRSGCTPAARKLPPKPSAPITGSCPR